jgi:hypothetical protein
VTYAHTSLRLSEYSDALAGKPKYLVIGNHDTRVSTAAACNFYVSLGEADARHGVDDSLICFQVQNVPGHSSQAAWHDEAAQFLMNAVAAPPK